MEKKKLVIKRAKTMFRTSHVMFAVLFLCAIGTATAGTRAYNCEVSHIYDLAVNGTLKSSAWEKDMKGSTFSVSRETGEITGQVLPTLSAKSVRVINNGSKQNSFKSVADFGDQYQILEVQEFREGAMKPFVASSMGGAGVVSGVCK